MKNEELLRKYLDGELSPEEEQEALHVIADDPELRSLLRFEQHIYAAFSDVSEQDSFQVPGGFTDRVMAQISVAPAEERQPVFDTVKQWFEQLLSPRQVQLRPVYGLAAIILLVASLSFPLYLVQSEDSGGATGNIPDTSIQQVSSTSNQVWLRFVYIDEKAESMAVAGDFSNWEPIPLTKQTVNGEQVWTGLVSMNRGEHHYMFLKNGDQWLTDPLAPVQREDGFGNKNAVIYL